MNISYTIHYWLLLVLLVFWPIYTHGSGENRCINACSSGNFVWFEIGRCLLVFIVITGVASSYENLITIFCFCPKECLKYKSTRLSSLVYRFGRKHNHVCSLNVYLYHWLFFLRPWYHSDIGTFSGLIYICVSAHYDTS